MSQIQFITDGAGNRVSVILPVALFEKLAGDSDLDELYEDVQNEPSASPDTLYPNEVVNILRNVAAPCRRRGESIAE